MIIPARGTNKGPPIRHHLALKPEAGGVLVTLNRGKEARKIHGRNGGTSCLRQCYKRCMSIDYDDLPKIVDVVFPQSQTYVLLCYSVPGLRVSVTVYLSTWPNFGEGKKGPEK